LRLGKERLAGVETAAELIFGVEAMDLPVAQATEPQAVFFHFLAGVIPFEGTLSVVFSRNEVMKGKWFCSAAELAALGCIRFASHG
jgi:hypothetical protein